MKNKLDYYHSEIFEYIYNILKEYIQLKDEIYNEYNSHYELQYLIIRYIIEYNDEFDFKKYENNEKNFLNELLFKKDYNFYNYFYDYFINIQKNICNINKKGIYIKLSDKDLLIEKSNLEMFILFKDEIKRLEIEKYKFNYEYTNIYKNTFLLMSYIKNKIETNSDKKLFKNRPLLLKYMKLTFLDDFYLKLDSINKEFDYNKEIYKLYKNKNIKIIDVSEIKENKIEDFLIENIEIINPNYRVIDRQLKVKDGIIDILCQDENDNYIIIELKNKQTKSIVWQSIYYPDVLKDILNIKNKEIKFIAFCPDFKDVIYRVLKKINNVEMLQYTVVLDINSNNIVDLILEKKN